MPRLTRLTNYFALIFGTNDSNFMFRPILRREGWDPSIVARSAFTAGIGNWSATEAAEMAAWIYGLNISGREGGFDLSVATDAGFALLGGNLGSTDEFFSLHAIGRNTTRAGLDAVALLDGNGGLAIVVKGTDGLSDWLWNAATSLGFDAQMNAAWTYGTQIAEQILQSTDPISSIKLTGQSLGSPMASVIMAAIAARLSGTDSSYSQAQIEGMLDGFGFAAPGWRSEMQDFIDELAAGNALTPEQAQWLMGTMEDSFQPYRMVNDAIDATGADVYGNTLITGPQILFEETRMIDGSVRTVLVNNGFSAHSPQMYAMVTQAFGAWSAETGSTVVIDKFGRVHAYGATEAPSADESTTFQYTDANGNGTTAAIYFHS